MPSRKKTALMTWEPGPGRPDGSGPKYITPLVLRQTVMAAYPELFNDLIKVAKGEDSPGIKADKLTPEMILTARFRILDKMIPNLKPMSEAELIAALKDQDLGETTNESVDRVRALFSQLLTARGAVPQRSGDGGQVDDASPRQTVDQPAG